MTCFELIYIISVCRDVIDYLRWVSPASLQATSISLPAAQQVISAMDVISGRDGSDRGHRKIVQLRNNANTMRRELEALGLGVLGSYDSPVVVLPLEIYIIMLWEVDRSLFASVGCRLGGVVLAMCRAVRAIVMGV